MKLGDANEKALLRGVEPLIQKGAIIKSGRHTYLIEHVRGSTVTARILIPWHVRAAAAVARWAARVARFLHLPRPTRPAKAPPVPAAGDKFDVVHPGIRRDR